MGMVTNTTYEEYAEKIKAEAAWIKSSERQFALFGVSNTSKQILKLLRHFHKDVVCFIDNDKTKQGKNLDGIEILSVEDAVQYRSKAAVIIGLLNNDNYKIVEGQLKERGFETVVGKDSGLLLYYLHLVENGKSEEDLLRCLYILGNKKDREGIIFDLSHFITHKCTLRCENCGAMVPYYKNPAEYPAEEIDADLHKVANAMDGIYNINLLGGEPFLHRDIVKICEDVCKKKNILNVTITTNATFIPKIDFEALAKTGVIVNISNYGTLSVKKEELTRLLEQHGIIYTVKDEDSEWYEVKPPEKTERTEQEYIDLYKNCILRRQCIVLLDGRLYPCNYVALFGKAGLYQEKPEDSVDVRGIKERELLKRQIVEIIHKKRYIPGCKYCDFDFERKVQGGVQDNKE